VRAVASKVTKFRIESTQQLFQAFAYIFRHRVDTYLLEPVPGMKLDFDFAKLKNGEWIEQLILGHVDEIMQRGALKTITSAQLENMRNSFVQQMRDIRSCVELEDASRHATFCVLTAFILGAAIGETDAAPELLSDFKKAHTRKANEARKSESIDRIIEDAVRDNSGRNLQNRKKSDQARVIWKAIKPKLTEARGLPKTWRSESWLDEKLMIERVRKRIETLEKRQSSNKNSG